MHPTSFSFFPPEARAFWGLRLFMVVSGFVLLWASAQFKFAIGPVPISLQLLVVLACGFVMDWPTALTTVTAYAGAAFVNGPLFAAANTTFTGGYLLGFVLAAVLIARIWRHVPQSDDRYRRFTAVFVLGLAGAAIVHLLGFAWLHTALLAVSPRPECGNDAGCWHVAIHTARYCQVPAGGGLCEPQDLNIAVLYAR